MVGGGITGLAATHRLFEHQQRTGLPVEPILFESTEHLGGVIWSLREEGYLLEEGPDSFITEKPAATQLAKRLGIDDRLQGTRPEYRQSFVVRNGRLEPTPEGFYLLSPSALGPLFSSKIFSWGGKLRMAMEPWVRRGDHGGDESLGQFVERRFGREALDRMAQPMVAGIYGADPWKLSLAATFPRFLDMEQEYGSVIRGMRARMKHRKRQGGAASGARYGLFATFQGGMQTLPAALESAIPPSAIRRRCPVHALHFTPDETWRLDTALGPVDLDAIVLACPSDAASGLTSSFDPLLSGLTARIHRGSSITVNLGFREEQIEHPMNGAGFVVPAIEPYDLIGCTFSHRKYEGRAPVGRALIRGYYGSAALEWSDSELIERAIEEIGSLLGIKDGPEVVLVGRYPETMPTYEVGHLELVGKISESVARHPRFELAGSSYFGVGIPDCIASGESAADRVFDAIAPAASGTPVTAAQ